MQEFNLSYEYVLAMTWREFQLRSYGWHQSENRSWQKVRKITYYSLVASGSIDSKKTSEVAFMPIGDEVSDKKSVLEMLKEAKEKLKNGR